MKPRGRSLARKETAALPPCGISASRKASLKPRLSWQEELAIIEPIGDMESVHMAALRKGVCVLLELRRAPVWRPGIYIAHPAVSALV